MPARKESIPKSSDEIRDAFLSFFQEKGHLLVDSSSLIPERDPTLLLTSAGMVQFKPYFTGEQTPPAPRLASCQKCFRTTDIDSVGDPKHLTFFEMLGNFSIGDYFKKEAIEWAWEFVTRCLSLLPERLWITIYLDDDEAYQHWRNIGVPHERIVRYGEKENFWGPAGEEGPCGPCSEIHYDYGEVPGVEAHECGPSCSCGRFVELWNLVFTQYYQDRQGVRTPLPKPNIDTGMGLERAAAIMQGKRTIYENDAFAPLIQQVAKMGGKTYGKDAEIDKAIRVVAEHARSAAFLIADGVVPFKEGRGYVLRKLIRRAIRFGKNLGLKSPFLGEVAKAVIERMGHVYPELEKNQDFILKVIDLEEERFGEVFETGNQFLVALLAVKEFILKRAGLLEIQFQDEALGAKNYPSHDRARHFLEYLTAHLKEPKERIVSGFIPYLFRGLSATRDEFNQIVQTLEDGNSRVALLVQTLGETNEVESSAQKIWADMLSRLRELATRPVGGDVIFVLYDTYGFPPELTEEVLRERGFSADMEGFRREMENQRERARATARFGLGEKVSNEVYEQLGIGANRFVGYDRLQERSVVVALLMEGIPAQRAEQGYPVEVILRETPFYSEMGGQVGDSGDITGPNGRVRVSDTQMPLQDLIVHKGKVEEGVLAVGDVVELRVDPVLRGDIARNHTATHLLHAALRRSLGSHVHQAGSLVTPDRLRFDFSHLVAVAPEELAEIQHVVNEKIRDNLSVAWEVMPYSQAIAKGALAFFGDKYGDRVRVVAIGDGGTFSMELCGGTHVASTGQLGFCLILGESSVGSGMRRIEALTGRGLENFLKMRLATLDKVAKRLQSSPAELEGRVESLMEELERERKRSAAIERELLRRVVEALLPQVQSVNGVSVLAAAVPASSEDALRETGDWLKARLGSGIIVLGAAIGERLSFVAMVTPDLVARGFHAGELIKRVAAIAGGGGGGRAEMAQAGGRDKSKLNEALSRVASIVGEHW